MVGSSVYGFGWIKKKLPSETEIARSKEDFANRIAGMGRIRTGPTTYREDFRAAYRSNFEHFPAVPVIKTGVFGTMGNLIVGQPINAVKDLAAGVAAPIYGIGRFGEGLAKVMIMGRNKRGWTGEIAKPDSEWLNWRDPSR